MFKLNEAISLVLLYSLLVFGLVWVVLYGLNLNFGTILALFALAFVIYVLIDKMGFNNNHKIFVGLAIWLNVFAYIYFYQRYLYFGYIVHFVDSILITFMVYDYYRRNLKVKKVYLFIFVFLTVVGLASMWEVYEYLFNAIFHMRTQGIFVSGKFFVYPIDDTMWDIIVACIGSLLTLITRELSGN